MKPHNQIIMKLGFETFEEYHEGALLSSGFKGQEIRVSHPLMNIQAKPLAFYPLTNPSFTSQTLWIHIDQLMDEWLMHMNELLMYATDPQVRWLDGKMKKWRANFWVQQLHIENCLLEREDQSK